MNEEYQENYEQEEPQGGFGYFIQEQMQYVPWWMISIVLHIIIICITFLIVVEKPLKLVEREIQTSLEPDKLVEKAPEEPVRKPQTQTKTVNEKAPPVKDVEVRDVKVDERSEENLDQDELMKGDDDSEAVSDSPLKGSFDFSELGVGGNAGNTFGGRLGGKADLVKKFGGSVKTENAVYAGLLWLKKHQAADGSWNPAGFTGQCDAGDECTGAGTSWTTPGITGLALLCFLGAGMTTEDGEFSQQVNNGVNYLRSIQDTEGCYGGREGHYMYNHAIATLAMAEAYALSNYFPLIKESAQKGVNFIVNGQNPGKAWRYKSRSGDNDTSVTGWCVMALKSAKVAQLDVPTKAFRGAENFLNDMTDESKYYAVGYMQKGQPVGQKGFGTNQSLTAVAMTARVFMGTEPTSPYLSGGSDLLLRDPPSWGQGVNGNSTIDYYYWYYGTLAMFQMGGSKWEQWNAKLKSVLLDHQEKSGCKKGSWEPAGKWCKVPNAAGGRIYATALNILSLEIYYRYDKVFK